MPAAAVDFWFEVLGKLTAALLAIAAALYGIQRTLKRDKREDQDADLLGRGKSTLFEQYDGLIRRLKEEADSAKEEQSRLRAEVAALRETVTQSTRRILELELERKVSREAFARLVNEVRGIKRGAVDPLDVDTGIYQPHLHS